ncbi:MAG TPA: hypothetical protein VFV08_04040 [Puia sp.]|nr:hypothetical protein [Puia sp.]
MYERYKDKLPFGKKLATAPATSSTSSTGVTGIAAAPSLNPTGGGAAIGPVPGGDTILNPVPSQPVQSQSGAVQTFDTNPAVLFSPPVTTVQVSPQQLKDIATVNNANQLVR